MVVENVTREEFQNLDKRVSKLEKGQAVHETRINNIDKKLDKIDNNTTWILRIVIGAVILAILGLVLKGGL